MSTPAEHPAPAVRRRPTLLDVAAAAGVSKSLASLALRGDEGVAARTRERIMAVADQLGYRPSLTARSLKQGRSMLVGVVISSLDNPYHTEIVASVEDAAEAMGLSVVLAHGSRRRDRLAERVQQLLDLGVDGLVVVSSWVPEAVLQAAARRAPVVMVGRTASPVAGIDAVNNDDEAGAALVVEHLLARGHERIAHVSSSRRPAGLARRRGYEAAMRSVGLESSLRVVEHGGGAGLSTELDALLADRYEAVFARNDVEAVAVIDHVLDAGRLVPDDLAVVGYDDTALARWVRPRLTSVQQQREEMGRLAVSLLTERLGGRAQDMRRMLAPRLVARSSG